VESRCAYLGLDKEIAESAPRDTVIVLRRREEKGIKNMCRVNQRVIKMCDISSLKIHRRCATPTDPIAVFIMLDEKQVGLCDKCWGKVAVSDFEWGLDPKIENFQEWLERERGLEGGILTDYDPTKKGASKYKTIQQEDEEITSEEELDEAEGKTLMEEDEERKSQEVSKS